MAYSNVFYTLDDLHRLHKELRNFLEEVAQEERLMLKETDEVGYYWNDDQYRKFFNYMQSLSEEIDQCSERLARSNAKLEDFISQLLRDA